MDDTLTPREPGLVVRSHLRRMQAIVAAAVEVAHEMGVAVYDDGEEIVFESEAQKKEWDERAQAEFKKRFGDSDE